MDRGAQWHHFGSGTFLVDGKIMDLSGFGRKALTFNKNTVSRNSTFKLCLDQTTPPQMTAMTAG